MVVEAERFAEGLIGDVELEAAIVVSMKSFERENQRRREAGTEWQRFELDAINAVGRVHRPEEGGRSGTLWAAAAAWVGAAVGAETPDPIRSQETQAEWARQASLLRDVMGNPFRSVSINTCWLTWNDRTIPKIAAGIYADRAFDSLPILADALEDAGCDNADLLAHCRGPGPHVRGCWAVDLILGKQ
jgi:hypothetical protein